MTQRLLRTQLIIENCERHLKSVNTDEKLEIESYLTQHALVVMCADIQQELYSILERRANMARDAELTNFSISAGKKVLRSIGKGELSGFVSNFSNEAKIFLNSHADDREVTLYNSAVSNRHDVAHKGGTNVTFRELKDIVIAAEHILELVEQSISPGRPAAIG